MFIVEYLVKKCLQVFLLFSVCFEIILRKMMSPDAYIDICEQPAANLKRLRYKTEGSTPPIEGVGTSRMRKTFPAIMILKYTGPATIKVSTVTANEPYR